jgi:anthraniloyl-CoA monooxygenase
MADRFGARVDEGRGLFMWLGCDKRLDSNLFAPVRTDVGLFNIHCYPYSENRSTIGVETDTTTWLKAGMDVSTRLTPTGDSDDRSIAYLQNVFGGVLDGARLLGNRSRWAHFRTVTVDRWSNGNVVLIGDAAHTAHYSVGSGTKMAMEDAVSLVTALTTAPGEGLGAALAAYEADRRPRVEKLQALADRSRWWWESLGERLVLPPPVLMVAYLSRGGVVSARRLAESDPALLRYALACAGLGANLTDPRRVATQILQNPVGIGVRRLPTRVLGDAPGLNVYKLAADVHDPWGDEAEALVRKAQSFTASSPGIVVLTGSQSRSAVLDRLAVGERIRTGSGTAVAVEADSCHIDDIADAIIAGRIDMVRFIDPLAQQN